MAAITRSQFESALRRIADSDRTPEEKRRIITDFGNRFQIADEANDPQLEGLSPSQREEFIAARDQRDSLSSQLAQAQRAEELALQDRDLGTAAASVLDTATFGRADEIVAALQTAFGEGDFNKENILRRADANERARLEAERANPVSSATGSLLGAVVPSLIAPGVGTTASLARLGAVGLGSGLLSDTRRAGETDLFDLSRAATNATSAGALTAGIPLVGRAAGTVGRFASNRGKDISNLALKGLASTGSPTANLINRSPKAKAAIAKGLKPLKSKFSALANSTPAELSRKIATDPVVQAALLQNQLRD